MVKRIDPRLPNTWGHWWIEIDGEQSYGWWPSPCPMGWRGAMLGTGGCLNGMDTADGGSLTRDAYHGDEPDHWFHPTLVVDKTDDEVRAGIRSFAQAYAGGFRWQWWWLRKGAENCRTFQDQMFEAVGLFEDPEYLYSRGSGCPFMYPFRRLKWQTGDALAGAVAWLRSRLPRAPRRPPADLEVAAGNRVSGFPALPLTDPRGRAQARARGALSSTPCAVERRDNRTYEVSS